MSTSFGVRPASVAGGSGSICHERIYRSPGRRPMQGWMRVSRTSPAPELVDHAGKGLERRVRVGEAGMELDGIEDLRIVVQQHRQQREGAQPLRAGSAPDEKDRA